MLLWLDSTQKRCNSCNKRIDGSKYSYISINYATKPLFALANNLINEVLLYIAKKYNISCLWLPLSYKVYFCHKKPLESAKADFAFTWYVTYSARRDEKNEWKKQCVGYTLYSYVHIYTRGSDGDKLGYVVSSSAKRTQFIYCVCIRIEKMYFLAYSL